MCPRKDKPQRGLVPLTIGEMLFEELCKQRAAEATFLAHADGCFRELLNVIRIHVSKMSIS